MTDQHAHHSDDYQHLENELRSHRQRFRLLAGGLVAAMLAFNVAPVAANHLNVKTSDINNGAVTTPKLRDDAVNAPKIRNRAVGNVKIARGVPGIAVAGADVNAACTSTFNWFNRFGAAPTVNRPSTGICDVTFPGLEGQLGAEAIPVAIMFGVSPGMITYSSLNFNSIRIRTFDSSGNLADRDFDLVIMHRNPSAAGAHADVADDDARSKPHD